MRAERAIELLPGGRTVHRIAGRSVAATVAMTLIAGCMMPAYRFPAGFSSTYFRHLYADDPRAIPHRLPGSTLESTPIVPPPDSLPPSPAPSDPDDVPDAGLPALKHPSFPMEPRSLRTPPAPLPEDDEPTASDSSDGSARDGAPEARTRSKSLANTAMSLST